MKKEVTMMLQPDGLFTLLDGKENAWANLAAYFAVKKATELTTLKKARQLLTEAVIKGENQWIEWMSGDDDSILNETLQQSSLGYKDYLMYQKKRLHDQTKEAIEKVNSKIGNVNIHDSTYRRGWACDNKPLPKDWTDLVESD